jgi:hypothetical protein
VYTKVQASFSRTSRIPTISTILPSLHPIATHDVPPTIEFRGFSAMCRYRQTLLSKAKTVRGRSSPQRSSLFPVTFFETPTFPSQHQGSTLRKFAPQCFNPAPQLSLFLISNTQLTWFAGYPHFAYHDMQSRFERKFTSGHVPARVLRQLRPCSSALRNHPCSRTVYLSIMQLVRRSQ